MYIHLPLILSLAHAFHPFSSTQSASLLSHLPPRNLVNGMFSERADYCVLNSFRALAAPTALLLQHIASLDIERSLSNPPTHKQ